MNQRIAGLLSLLHSRKFWALVTALATTAVLYQNGQVPAGQAELAVVASLSAYMVSTGIESAGENIGGTK